MRAAQALASVGEAAIEALTRALRDRDPKVRGGAALALELMGDRASPAIPALIAAMADPEPPDDPRPHEKQDLDDASGSPQPRPSGYQAALVAIGRASVPALLQRLDSSDRTTRMTAVRTIGLLGEEERKPCPA